MSMKRYAKKASNKKAGPEAWARMYRQAKRKGMPFTQAIELFTAEHGIAPDPAWPLMPACEIDVHRLVRDVPTEHLVQAKKPNKAGRRKPQSKGGRS
jgi:hypothetical protein